MRCSLRNRREHYRALSEGRADRQGLQGQGDPSDTRTPLQLGYPRFFWAPQRRLARELEERRALVGLVTSSFPRLRG